MFTFIALMGTTFNKLNINYNHRESMFVEIYLFWQIFVVDVVCIWEMSKNQGIVSHYFMKMG